jgi:hypothetical protein
MQEWRKHILFYSVIAMMLSLFLSRALLSASIAVFVITCLFYSGSKELGKRFFSSSLLWGISLLFLLPLLSGLWTGDKQEWINVLRIKLPLLLFPLAFAAPFTFSKKQWNRLVYSFIIIITAGTIWSMFHYATNMAVVNEGYLRAKMIITPLENDHVRFSWLVSVAVLLAGWLWWRNRKEKNSSWLLLTVVWLGVFLHILAARTGLLSFYITLLATTLFVVFKKVKRLYGTALLLLLFALPVAAYFILPTFRNKVKYFLYDFEYVKDAHYLAGGNDASRIISLKAGWSLMNDHSVSGVGFGDIFTETGKWYSVNYPEVQQQDKILPSNEWLIYGAGCGIPGFLFFTFVMLAPFFINTKNKWGWWLLNCLIAFSFLFDIGLEVQFGIFIYCFVVLFGWKWFRREA